jgi:hypothetical protein
MAYRRSNGKGRRKIEPAVKTLTFAIPHGAQISTIDISQCASLVNRRFYRQGINWAVSSFTLFTPEGTTGAVSVGKLPETWVMSNAWEKSFRAWQRMNDEALEESESVRPRFLDFKIFADASHHQAGVVGNLLPIDLAANNYAAGEWKSSVVEIPDVLTTDDSRVVPYDMIAVGPSYPGSSAATTRDAVSLIEGYAASRGLPYQTDPNVPGDADSIGPNTADPQNWIASIFTDGTDQDEQVLERLVADNNQAPYPFENAIVGGVTITDTQYPGGANQAPTLDYWDSAFVTGTTVGGKTNMRGGSFPCGLVRIASNLSEPLSGSILLQVHLVPGMHRGYLCEPMTEM